LSWWMLSGNSRTTVEEREIEIFYIRNPSTGVEEEYLYHIQEVQKNQKKKKPTEERG